MSDLTEVLKLFKYDPATDGDMTFNIGQCMNDNWDKLDAAILLAIAAAGAYNPEESYAVGDYCTYKGKLRKCSTAIPTGETWTEAHWTTTTVAAEMQELSSQLSNLESSKLNKTLRTGSGQDLNAIIPSSGSIEVYRVFNPSANVPPGYTENSCDFFLIAICDAAQLYVLQYAFDVRSTAIWTRRSYDDSGVIHWQDWKQIVLATPPQEFDLPLASGWSNYSGMRSRYWKNQFDEVSVVVDISNPNTVSHGAVVATLPEGFRPAAAFDAPTIIYDGSEILPVRAYFSTNGQISISGYSNQTWSKVLFFETQASFIAVS